MPAPWGVFAAYVVLLSIQRAAELALSRRNLRRVTSRGGREVAAGHFAGFAALHAAYPMLLGLEIASGARPGPAWPWWLALWLGAQFLRLAAIHALGERWNVRIVVVPGEAPLTGGVYRWLRHPNYLAVILEFIAAPLGFGAWRTALACSIANAVLLAIRIPAEERELARAARHTD